MNSAPPDRLPLEPWRQRLITAGLALAASLAAIACVQVLVWPRRPEAPRPLAAIPGWSPIGERPGRSDATTSLSATLRFRPTDPAFAGVELSLTTLAQTSDEGIEVAALTADQPTLSLGGRRLLRLDAKDQRPGPGVPSPLPKGPGGRRLHQVALGQLQGQTALQTCLTARGYGITRNATQILLFSSATTLQQRWQYLLRSWPPEPHTCLLASLKGDVPPATLLTAWQRLRPVLQATLPKRS